MSSLLHSQIGESQSHHLSTAKQMVEGGVQVSQIPVIYPIILSAFFSYPLIILHYPIFNADVSQSSLLGPTVFLLPNLTLAILWEELTHWKRL